MTVAQLIAQLSLLPQDLPILLDQGIEYPGKALRVACVSIGTLDIESQEIYINETEFFRSLDYYHSLGYTEEDFIPEARRSCRVVVIEGLAT